MNVRCNVAKWYRWYIIILRCLEIMELLINSNKLDYCLTNNNRGVNHYWRTGLRKYTLPDNYRHSGTVARIRLWFCNQINSGLWMCLIQTWDGCSTTTLTPLILHSCLFKQIKTYSGIFFKYRYYLTRLESSHVKFFQSYDLVQSPEVVSNKVLQVGFGCLHFLLEWYAFRLLLPLLVSVQFNSQDQA